MRNINKDKLMITDVAISLRMVNEDTKLVDNICLLGSTIKNK